MKNLYFITLLLWVFPFTMFGQNTPPVLQWQKCLGGARSEDANASVKTTDGGFLVTATDRSNGGIGSCPNLGNQISLVKFSYTGTVQWTKCLGGFGVEEKSDIKNTPDGGFIVAAYSSSNDTIVGTNHGASDAYIAKLDKNGNIEWQKLYGGSSSDAATNIEVTRDGGYIFIGQTYSNNGDVSGNHGNADIWVVKLNSTGVIEWQKCYGGSGFDFINRTSNSGGGIRETTDGYVFVGQTQSPDGQVTGFHYDPSFIRDDIWAVKLNTSGNIMWQKCLGGSLDDQAAKIEQTVDGGYFISGTTNSIDGDVTPLHGSSTNINTDIWLIKLAANGAISWSKVYGGTRGENAGSMALTSNGDVFIAGSASSADGDVTGVRPDVNCGCGTDAWVLKVNSSGTLIWQKTFGGRRPDGFSNILVDDDGELLLTGNTQSDDGDVSGSSHPYPNYTNSYTDGWVVKTGNYNTIKGTAFLDKNLNGIKDGTDVFLKEGMVKSQKNGYVSESAIVNGNFNLRVDTGTFTTSLNVPGYNVITNNVQSVFNTYFNTDSISFAVQPIPGIRDYQVDLFSITPARPGFNATYKIKYANRGTDTLNNKTIKLVKDPKLQFLSSVPATSSTNGDTLAWNISTLLPADTAFITINLKGAMPPVLNAGDVLSSIAFIDSTLDVTPSNNSDVLHQLVTGSFDPNDKQENHGGIFYIEQLQANQPLTYTIRFQNMGTDTAFNIVVRDTLSDQLDVSTLEIIGASHPYQFNVKDNKYCTWTFNDILLPDFNTNEPASHGYVTYRIKPKSTLQLGDKIYNSASIYFDFNLPVQTNNHETVITLTPVQPPPQPIVSGLQLNYCKNLGAQTAKVLNLPTAASGINVTAKLDGTALTIAADSTVSFIVSGLTAGTHNLVVTYSNITDTLSTTASFTVTAAATPDVNLSANITNVVNLANPVIVTAANASGGGKDPRYTFAWNNSFTNIIQTESSNNTLSINAASLALGDNKVYAKMKTSEDCYTVQTNIDSITIRRDMSTGITDTDNPGQVITIYPNPVNGPITINGLSTGKTYTFTIVNLQGQVIFTKRVANQRTTSISTFKGESGVYWLNIYDEKRNRTLGSVQLIKK